MVTTWPKNFPGVGIAAQRIADRIGALSDGRLTVKLFAAGELVPAFEVFDAVREGKAWSVDATNLRALALAEIRRRDKDG